MSITSIDLTPNPRILQVIAEVDLDVYQCLAELVDNCFDELRKAAEEDASIERRIDITLPTHRQARSEVCTITVADTGRGMDLEQMRAAMRAGASSNNPVDNLGLFGMGFNIATARLGRRTEVKSGKAGSDQWNIVTIDLDEMTRGDSFTAPVRTEPKSMHEHGTVITVSRLGVEIVDRLKSTSTVKTTTSKLGRIYTYLLRDPQSQGISGGEVMGGLGLSLYLNGAPVRPVIPCIWSPERSVSYQGSDVPAVISIDHELAPGYVCMNCGHWHTLKPEACLECSSTLIEERDRRVWGWIGIQRYQHTKDYGLTFLRNGRAILFQNKDYFAFTYEDDTIDVEYPELREGRIVGEIHLDHVGVNVRKTDFDRESTSWSAARRFVRGEGPLRPKIAKQLGFVENTSPMARLFGAYRRSDAGLRYLVPGDGRAPLHNQAKQWGDRFHEGDPAYLTDDRWYEAAALHERGVEPDPTPTEDPQEVAEGLKSMGLSELLPQPHGSGDSSAAAATPASQPPVQPAETKADRIQRYIAVSTPLNELTGPAEISHRGFTLESYLCADPTMKAEDGGRGWALDVSAGTVRAFISSDHFLIQDYGWLPADALLLCISEPLGKLHAPGPDAVRAAIEGILSSFPDRRLTVQSCRNRGEELLQRLREAFSRATSEHPDLWIALPADAKVEAEEAGRQSNASMDWPAAIDSGEFGAFLTPVGMVSLVQERPEVLLDEQVLRTRYVTWGAKSRVSALRRVTGLLTDLGSLLELTQEADKRDLRRLSLSADVLEDLVVD